MMKFVGLLCLAAGATATWTKTATLDIVALDLKASDANNVYISGGVNGQAGIQLAKSSDGGKTFNMSMVTGTDLPLSLSIAINPPHILVSGLFTQYISSDDGNTWSETGGAHVGQSMWATFEDSKFFVIGDGLTFKGLAYSTNNGVSFTGVNVSALEPGSFPRFAAFPTEEAWYIAAGAQPQTTDDAPPMAEMALERRLKHTTGGNVAQILKTTDMGKTWTSLFYSTGKFYLMDIACSDPKTCCAISEADEMSPTLGVAIYCTFDGETFNTTYTDYTPGTSLMDMQYLGNNNWVASGTFAAGGAPTATFVRSSDGGHTWTPDEATSAPKIAVVASDFPTPSVGFALGIDEFNSEMLLSYSK